MKRWTVGLAAWFGVVATLSGVAYADDDAPKATVGVDAQVAFGGFYRERGFASALIEVGNAGEERRVKVSLQGASVSRTVEMDLTQGARKRLRLMAPLSDLGTLWVTVSDAKTGKQLARRTPRMRRLVADQPLLVYIGKRPPGLKRRSMEEMLLGGEPDDAQDEQQDDPPMAPLPTQEDMSNQPRVARATLSELPTSWLGYHAVTALFWSHPTVDRLSPEQVEALRRWVMTGGHLVVAVDDDWRQVSGSALAPLLPATLTGVETVANQELGAMLLPQTTAGALVAQAPVAQVTRRPGASGVVGLGVAGEESAALSWRVADGRVTLWRVGWERTGLEWSMDMWKAWAQAETTRQMTSEMWRVAKDDEPRLEINVVALILVLLAYVLYIGPIDYLVLRSFKRLEWTVWTYSASILLFGALAWLVMATSQSDAGLVSRTEVSHWFLGQPGQQEAQVRVQTLTGYFTTERERIAVEPLDDGSALWLERPPSLMSLLNTEQRLVGVPARLEATAAAYALLPIRIETFQTRPTPLEVELSEPPTPGSVRPPEVGRLRNMTDQRLTGCLLMTHSFVSAKLFELPPGSWTEVPEFRERLKSLSERMVEESELDRYQHPMHHMGNALRLGKEQGGVWPVVLVCEGERALLGEEEPTKLGEASVERKEHVIMRFVFEIHAGEEP